MGAVRWVCVKVFARYVYELPVPFALVLLPLLITKIGVQNMRGWKWHVYILLTSDMLQTSDNGAPVWLAPSAPEVVLLPEKHTTSSIEEVCAALASIDRRVVALPQRVYDGMRSVLGSDKLLSPSLVRALFHHDQPLASSVLLSMAQLLALTEYCVSDLDVKSAHLLKGNRFR